MIHLILCIPAKILIPAAIEEVLRFSSPVRGMFRITLKDNEMSGRQIKAGQAVMAGSEPPIAMDRNFQMLAISIFRRKPNSHIAFGHGIHMCIGAPLARLESKVAIELLSEKYSSVKLRIPEGELQPVRNVAVSGVRHLPVKFVA